jgi:hypothetical protein
MPTAVIFADWSNRPRIVFANAAMLAEPWSKPRDDRSVLAASLRCCASSFCASRCALAASASNARNAFGSKSPPSLALNSSRLVVRARTSSSALL